MSRSRPRRASRRPLLLLLLVVPALLLGCAGKRLSGGPTRAVVADVAVYRGHLVGPEGGRDRFQMTMFAARPDRVHAELAGPVGGPRWIVDGGGGRLAITVVEQRTAYVGEADRAALGRAFGLALALDDWVGALLDGRRPAGLRRFRREPARDPGWPERLEVGAGDVTLRLTLRRTRSLPDGADAALGTGVPAPGLTVRPLAELPDARPDSGP